VSAHEASWAAAADVLRGRTLAILSGAGLSTESGIPDYRGPGTRERARNPIQHRAFLNDPLTRARYWRRSLEGWPRFSAAAPNAGHAAVARLEHAALTTGVVTQNVDGLHQRAGASDVVELHGTLSRVRCLSCGAHVARADLQERLLALNPGFAPDAAARPPFGPGAAEDPQTRLAPDGDAEVEDSAGFVVPDCARCGGVLKPDVVFFGDNVPAPWVEAAFERVHAAEALLVIGTSLTVYSGFRFVRRASERGMPIVIVNLGPTRGDPLATVHVDAPTGMALPWLAQALGA
jgi:NAD-dependent deacetylase sirtuin 4